MFRVVVAICVLCAFASSIPYIPLTIAIGHTGFLSSAVLMSIFYLFSIACCLLYVEAFIAVPEAEHIVSLSRRLTGTLGSRFNSAVYLIYNYIQLLFGTIYIYGLITELLPDAGAFSNHLLFLCLILFTGIFFGMGRKIGLALIAAAFFILFSLLTYAFFIAKPFAFSVSKESQSSFYGIFLLGASFNNIFCQSLLPSLIVYLKKDRKRLLISLWVGLMLALVLQMIWVWMTLRSDIYKHFLAAIESTKLDSENFNFLDFLPQFRVAYLAMSVTTILFTFWCFVVGLMDFYRDMYLRLNKVYLVALIFLPPWLAYLLLDSILETFRSVLVVLSSLLLASFIPVAWVWTLRYHLGTPVSPVLKGGEKNVGCHSHFCRVFILRAADFSPKNLLVKYSSIL